MLLIGADEAGYGPNLGPLVVAATAWEVPDGESPSDLYAELSDVLTPDADGLNRSPARLPVADSKRLYASGSGLDALERGVLALAGTLDMHPRTWRELWPRLAPGSRSPWETAPWYETHEAATPVGVPVEQVLEWTGRLGRRFERGSAAQGDPSGDVVPRRVQHTRRRRGRQRRGALRDDPVVGPRRDGRSSTGTRRSVLRQARRAQSLWRVAPAALARRLDRGAGRRTRMQPVSVGAGEPARGIRIPRRWRSQSALCVGLDGGEVPA